MIHWTQRYFMKQIYVPVYKFALKHCTPSELADLLLWLKLAWQKPRQAQEMYILFERELALRLPGYNRSLTVEEDAYFNDDGDIERNFCRYESHRMGKSENSHRLSWNSPDRDAGPPNPENHHTGWHAHEGDSISSLPDSSGTNINLFIEYLNWLEERTASERN